MVDRIGSGGSLAREAILAAMKSQATQTAGVEDASRLVSDQVGIGDEVQKTSDFTAKLEDHIKELDSEAKRINDLPRALINGEIKDFHQIAVEIKKAEFSFRFALEIRNKLIDSYREVMRMNV